MLTSIPEEEHQVTLARWRGAEALISRFDASLRRLLMQLYRPDDKDGMLYLLAVGCQRITGPFSWDSAEIKISEVLNGTRKGMPRLTDENVGFELQYRGGLILYYGTSEGIDFFGDPAEKPGAPS
jgi:hypothetical protein